MPERPLISLCIPTYNRAPFLAVALRSIASQDLAEVEVVVSDNASTDDTASVVGTFADEIPRLRFCRKATNAGFDENYASAIEAATGRFCWMLGDDDFVEPQAIARVVELLREAPETIGLTVGCNTYDVAGNVVASWSGRGDVESITGAPEIFAHRRLAYLFGNMSLHVFRTDLARSVMARHRLFHNSCSCHHLLCLLVAEHERWTFVDEPLAAWRAGNDSFARNGLYRRARIALHSYAENVADAFGKKSPVYGRFMNDEVTTIARQYVLRAKNHQRFSRHLRPYHCSRRERWKINAAALRVLYAYPRYWKAVAPLYFVPGTVLAAAGAAKEWLQRRSGG